MKLRNEDRKESIFFNLDYAASTPVDEDVQDNFIKVTKEEYVNPSHLKKKVILKSSHFYTEHYLE